MDKNIDDAYDSFLEETEKLINKHFLFEKVSKRKLKQQIRKPWISNGLMKQINYKNKLHKKSKTEKEMNIRNELANEHKVLQRTLRKEIQLEKDRYYQKFFRDNKSNLIKVWKNIKNLINFKPKVNNKNIKLLYIDEGKVSSNPQEISNFFNKHFTTVGAKTEKRIITSNRNFSTYLKIPNGKTFSLYPTTPSEVEGYLKSINIRKSVGPFSIPNRILKEFNKLLSIPLSEIFNLSLESSIVPKNMKIARVIPIFKKGDNQDFNNYRPISLLPNISKLFEKVIKNSHS